MFNLSKPKLGKFLATIAALSSVTAILTTANKAEAIPLYPNDFGSNTQTVRLQMERTAPNGLPVTINITRAYGLKNGGLLNTWTGNPDDESLYNYITNGYGINFQSKNGNYSISSPTVEILDGTRLNTYTTGFGRYQDWNIEKLGGQYGDTYLFHWRTDTNTNLCLDIRGFAPGQKLVNEVPGLSYCDGNNPNQRIRVIKQTQGIIEPVNRPRNPLINGTIIPPGTSIKSNNQCFRLDAQSDGNLVLYRQSNGQALWATGTDRRNVKQTIFQNDGNLVIYNTSNQAVWASNTDRRGGTKLIVQDDGNFVMYNAQNQALWASNTVASCTNSSGYILPFQAGYKARLDQALGAKTVSGTGITHGPTPLAIDLTVIATEYRASSGLYYSTAQARAIAAGQVIQASYQGIYGNTVVIRHDDGNTSQYSHLHNYAVQNGQRVSAGQNLGVIGMTASNARANQNNVHLHFEMKDRNGKYITFQFRDAPGANFYQPGIEVTAQNP